ncbi:DUF92 domain-containing protein [bacterium]|nr:DUF92 domain-containing protein [bacterium]NUN44630.1 DUF92 domain-containing protein [bacterium]
MDSIFWQVTLSDGIGYALAFLSLGVILATVELLRRRFFWPPEITRKITHIGVGILIFLAPSWFDSGAPAVYIGVFFVVFNMLAIRGHWLQGIHGTDRRSYGTVYYPMAFTMLVLLCWETAPLVLMSAMLVLALGDASAGLVGQLWPSPRHYYLTSDRKSIEGSITMFVVSTLVIAFSFLYYQNVHIAEFSKFTIICAALIGALLATIMEAISPAGSDNLTIPLTVAWVVYTITHQTEEATVYLIYGVGLAACVGWASFRFRLLTADGAAGAFLLGSVIFGIGGWMWALPILVFFISSSLLSRLGKRRKAQFDTIFEKGSTRDAGQVLANGGLAGAVALAAQLYPGEVWYIVYLAVIAAATADTWATEIGTFFQATPRSVLHWRKVQPGTSGGISLPGTLGAFTGSLWIAMTGAYVMGENLNIQGLWFVTLAGFLGSIADSFLGATLQAQYACQTCGKPTEKKQHCDEPTRQVRGLVWMHNDAVNMIASGFGGILAYIMMT